MGDERDRQDEIELFILQTRQRVDHYLEDAPDHLTPWLHLIKTGCGNFEDTLRCLGWDQARTRMRPAARMEVGDE